MIELPSKYNPQETESKWLKFWKDKNIFHAKADSGKKPFTIVIPPPNVTGILHMGHALNNTLQDIMVRYKRMNGFETLWMPGTDHAGIATQNVVEKQLAREGKTRQDLGRDEFLKRLWAWKQEYGDTIINQLEKLGSSCDWARTRFTMDDDYSEAVKEAFVLLHNKGLIYRGERIINWCTRCQTALSDEEVEHHEKNAKLYYILYPFKDKSLVVMPDTHSCSSFPDVSPTLSFPDVSPTLSFPRKRESISENGSPVKTFGDNSIQGIIVATTRPETMFGDTAVAVNPKDPRYTKFIGQTLTLPLVERPIKIIADDFVSMEFGTGAVKVTPAHDHNDFAMSQRHPDLEIINIMQPDGILNNNAGDFAGYHIHRAVLAEKGVRRMLLGELTKKGYFIEEKDHKHSVGHCYRCDEIVEPYLSKQWFVKMKDLARPALEAVQKGEIKIHPVHWAKVYTNWMVDIHDWCISRQIWWGHRIPVWYDKEGNYFVAKSEEEAEAQAKTKHGKVLKPDTRSCSPVELKQDEDVLDTWFSSWLWPFATLGWPKKNGDLKYFYPTNTLMTASEILFFWVARMVMAGYEFMGDKPFSDVLIHGTVRDAKGRKMSKSLGNAIDPLEIIDEYGADALRFSLIINSGQDILISKEKFEIGRNFANKIWNASRLVLSNTSDVIPANINSVIPANINSVIPVNINSVIPAKAGIQNVDDIEINNLDLPSRWIIARFYETLEKVNNAIEEFHYSEAEILIQEFFWGNYCDWYLELIKAKFSDPNIQKTALFVLKNSLKMMHPFIPFVTEEIYSKMNSKDKCLSLAAWPKQQEKLIDREASKQMQTIIDVISAIRNLYTKWNIKSTQAIIPRIIPQDKTQMQLLRTNSNDIARLARVGSIEIEFDIAIFEKSLAVLIHGAKIIIPSEEIIDFEVEKKRKNEEIKQKLKLVEGLQSRLSNEVFVSKAPEEVISKEKERLDTLNREIFELKNDLAGLN